MHRNRTWSLDLPEWRTQRNRVLAAEGGDGSTLSLDFTAGRLDSRFQVTRGTNATFIDSEGYVKYAAANQAIQSNSLTTTPAWTQQACTPSSVSGEIAPTGESAFQLIASSGSSSHLLYQTITTNIAIGIQYTLSAYVKRKDHDYVAIGLYSSGGGGKRYTALFSIPLNGTGSFITSNDAGTAPTGTRYSITYVSNGWYRLSVTMATTAADIYPHIMLATSASPTWTSAQPAFAFDNGGTYYSSVQLNAGAEPLSYIATTTTQKLDTPRFDFDPTTRQLNGLLIEPTNTNKASTSETLSGFSNQNMLFPPPISTSVVNPAGVANTLKIAASNTPLDWHARALAYVTPANTQEELTFSVWLKSNGYTKAFLADGNSGRFSATFDLANGIAVMNTDATGGTGSPPAPNRRCRMTAYRDGWWRCEVTVVAPSNPTGLVFSFGFAGYPDTGATIGAYGVQYAGTGNENDGIYAYGPQLEIGPIATSYIPTGTAAGGATRNADNISSTDVNWFTSNDRFTFLADFIPLTPVSGSVFPQIFSLFDTTAGGTYSNSCLFYYYSAVTANLHTMTLQTKITVNPSSSTDSTVATLQTYGQRHKLAYAINGTTSHIRSFDGNSVTNSPAAPVAVLPSGNVDTLYLGSAASASHMTGWLRGIKYWPSTKPIEELNRLTDLSAPSPTFEYDFTVGSIPATMAYTIDSTATFINSSGIVEYADANMVLFSNTMNNLSALRWILANAATPTTIASDLASPFTTAWKLVASTNTNIHSVRNSANAVTYVGGLPYTISVWAKTAEYRNLIISDPGGGVSAATFVLSGVGEGTATNISAGVGIGTATNATMVSAGNGWWRCSVTITPATSAIRSFGIMGYPDTGATINAFGATYNGDGTSGIYAYGLQINPGTTVDPYYETTTTAYHAPRFDYNPQTSPPEALGILNEGATTNLLRWSESFADTGAAVNWAYNGNAGSLVAITNPANGPQCFQFREPAGTGTAGGLLQSVTTLATASASAYTFSVWVRGSTFNSVTTTQVNIGIFTGGSFVSATTAVVHGQGSASGVSIGTVSGLSTSTWTRVRITTTANINASTAVDVYIWPQSTSFDANASILLWGAQLEPHSGVSSYIPTGASQVTRNATSLIVNDITPFNYNREGGTMYVEHRVSKAPPSNTYTMRVGFTSSTNLPVFEMFPSGLNWFTALRGDSLEGGGANERSLAYALNTNYKYAVAFNTRYNPILSLYQNTTFSTANAGNKSSGPSRLPNRFTFQRMDGNIQEAAGTIKSVKYWPIVLTAQQLKTLTQ
jgi:hypothetical protein